jgi:glucokinase
LEPIVNAYSLGIDLGGSSVKAVAVTPSGQVLSKKNIEFELDQQMDWAQKIKHLAQEIQAEHGTPASSIGLSAPGLAAKHGRSIAHMPGRLKGLENLDWTDFLGAPKPVPVLNDAHSALLGEAWLGAAADSANVLLLTLGTGVGGAAMVDGRLLHGQIGRAGHLGHVCLDLDGPPDIIGTPGSLEFMIGNYSIVERSDGRFRSTHDLIAAHGAGHAAAAHIWLKSVRALAAAIASLINVLDPEVVIIGGGIARAGESLFKPLQEFLDTIEWRPGGHCVKILPAKLGEFAGAIGAACHATKGVIPRR